MIQKRYMSTKKNDKTCQKMEVNLKFLPKIWITVTVAENMAPCI